MSFDRISNIVLTSAAVVLAVVIVRREFFTAGPTAGRGAVTATEIADWRSIAESGVWLHGDSSARVILTEFGDYQCPFCQMFHERLKVVQDSLTEPIAVLYVHFPLPNHRLAVPAANAAMCAAEQGRLNAMHDLLFTQQDSLGLRDWSALAEDAGVADQAAFKRCHDLSTPHPTVQRGMHLSDSLGIDYTPTVMINQWRYGEPPVDSLRVMLQAAIDRTSP